MSLRIVLYPHPTLRHVSKPLRRVDADLRKMIDEMFDLMYEAQGVGLAANQVDLPYRVFVANVTGDPEQPDQQLVFINPVITKRRGTAEAEEGCLSLPKLYGNVKRSEHVTITAYNLAGENVQYELQGLPARVVQHELDHLDGVLFIDRLSETGKLSVKRSLEDMEERLEVARSRGDIPDDKAIAQRLVELEKLRT